MVNANHPRDRKIDGDGDGFGGSQTITSTSFDCSDVGISDSGSDCDDGDPDLGDINSDADCDGVVTADDCNDELASLPFSTAITKPSQRNGSSFEYV